MSISEADYEVARAERDASRDGFPEFSVFRRPSQRDAEVPPTVLGHATAAAPTATQEHGVPPLDRIETASTGESSASSTHSQILREEIGMHRVHTTRDLERHPTELSRIHTHRSQHASTIGRNTSAKKTDTKSSRPLPAFGGGKPYPPTLPPAEEYVVEFEGSNDPMHPQNWPLKSKIFLAIVLGYDTLLSAFGSSLFSSAISPVAAEFGVSVEVGVLGLSFYVLGFATGPLIWAPLSELRGRRLPILIGSFGFTVFQIGTATGENLQTVLLCRFFGGFFAACPLAVVAAVFGDMFDNRMRGLAITVFSMMVFSGPLMAPFIGGFIVENESLGWRWTEYLMTILGASSFVLNIFFMRETYAPVVLVEKASELRRRTLNWGIHAKYDEVEIDFRELLTKNFSRPLRILFTEPIVLLLSIYMAFIYGLLYLFLTAYPIVFQQIHGMSPGVGGLPYFGMIIGMFLAGAVIVARTPQYNRKLAANNNIPVPEWRLPEVIAGGVSFAIGLFWFGWTGYREDIHWIAPTLSGLATGFGLLSIFLQSLNYIIDAYLMFSASSIAGNTLLRSLAGAGFPLFASYMFNALGVQWASTLVGCVALCLVPIPVIFLFYGKRLRQKSTFAPGYDIANQATVPRSSGEGGLESGDNSDGLEVEKTRESAKQQ